LGKENWKTGEAWKQKKKYSCPKARLLTADEQGREQGKGQTIKLPISPAQP